VRSWLSHSLYCTWEASFANSTGRIIPTAVWYIEINRLVYKYSSHKTSWNNVSFQCVTTCSNCLITSRTEYSFLSQQSAMCVRKRPGFLSPNRISELVWESESEEAGASSDCIIYLVNRILCIFRQLLKYLCFSYSFLDRVRKYHVEILDSPLWKTYRKW
jgi:hypothetical protein